MKFKCLSFLLILGLFAVACGDDEMMPDVTCDDENVTYTNGASAILNASCAVAGCHASGTTATFPMGNFAEASVAVGFGRIIGAINHETGFEPMPFPSGTAKLEQCDIDKLTGWINDGAPE